MFLCSQRNAALHKYKILFQVCCVSFTLLYNLFLHICLINLNVDLTVALDEKSKLSDSCFLCKEHVEWLCFEGMIDKIFSSLTFFQLLLAPGEEILNIDQRASLLSQPVKPPPVPPSLGLNGWICSWCFMDWPAFIPLICDTLSNTDSPKHAADSSFLFSDGRCWLACSSPYLCLLIKPDAQRRLEINK